MRDGLPVFTREGARLVAHDAAAREAIGAAVDDGERLVGVFAAPGALALVGDAAREALVTTLDVVSAVEVLTVLIAAHRTGVVRISTTEGERRLFLQEGRFVGSASTYVADRLGEVLWRNGRLSLDQVMIAAAQITREKKLGRILVELGYLTSPELRGALRDQARAVFEACCLEDRGVLVFQGGVRTANPTAFGEHTEQLLETVLTSLTDVERSLRVVGALDNDVTAASPPPDARLTDPAQAMLQLVASRRAASFRKRELIERSALGKRVGLRALEELLVTGYLEEEERTPPVPERPRAERLREALSLVVDALGREAPTVLVTIDDWLADPPPDVAALVGGLGVSSVRDLIGRAVLPVPDDEEDRAIAAVVDYALFEAVDALSRDDGQVLADKVRALGVL